MELILKSILVFAATNIDDLFVLTLFFGNKLYKPTGIFVGQFLGISLLVVISLVGAMAGNFISPPYIGLLGLFPIYLGIRQLLKKEDDNDDDVVPDQRNMIMSVTLITLANGGDNIGIYIPLFVTLSAIEKTAMLIIFLIMTLLWCIAAKYLSNHPLLKNALSKYGHRVTPIVLILLGLYILYENQSHTLIL